MILFGEATMNSGKYRIRIDGKPHSYMPDGQKEPTDLYDMTSARFNGNWNYHRTIVDNLDASVPHVLEIEPVLDGNAEAGVAHRKPVRGGGRRRDQGAADSEKPMTATAASKNAI